jgi:hypothetical protein
MSSVTKELIDLDQAILETQQKFDSVHFSGNNEEVIREKLIERLEKLEARREQLLAKESENSSQKNTYAVLYSALALKKEASKSHPISSLTIPLMRKEEAGTSVKGNSVFKPRSTREIQETNPTAKIKPPSWR